jgi:acyl carrier protein phosphodiesterase
MQAIIENSALPNREALLEQLKQMSQPNPQQQQMQQMAMQLEAQIKQAEAALKMAQAEKARIEAQLAPQESQAKVISALTNNLDENAEDKSFERRVKLAELMLQEKDIDSNKEIARMQTAASMMKTRQPSKVQ